MGYTGYLGSPSSTSTGSPASPFIGSPGSGGVINFTNIGNYRTITYDVPFVDVTNINGFVSDTTNEIPNYAYLYYEFRWSINGDNWSLWIEMTPDNLNLIQLDPNNSFYLEFRITAVTNSTNPSRSPALSIGSPINPAILLNDIEPDLTYKTVDPRDLATKPKIICSNQLYDKPIIFNASCTNVFDPYAVNRGINIEQDLSLAVNNLFGHLINYYSVQPNGRGRDIILREYNLFDVVGEQCLKVLINKNEFGDGKPVYDSFGVQFDEAGILEAHIDKRYFESFFGKGAQPRKRDIIYFPLTNRIYTIESTYLYRGFDYYPIYYKCRLVKYEKRQDTNWNDPAMEAELHDYTVSAETLFGKETQEQIEKNIKPQQYYVSSQKRGQDPVRSYISVNLPIIDYDLNNNWTIVFNSYYDLETLNYDNESEAVRYNASPTLTGEDEMSFTCWFKIRNFIDQTKLVPKPPRVLPITSVTQAAGTATYSTHPIKHQLTSNSYVSILGGTRTGGYKILSVDNTGYQFTIVDDGTPIGTVTSWQMQKADSRSLISGYNNSNGISIEMIYTGTNTVSTDPITTSPAQIIQNYLQVGSFRILLNGTEILSPFGYSINNPSSNFIPSLDDWYGFVFNLSNVFKQYSINVWGLTYNPSNPMVQTSNLLLLHTKEGFLSTTYSYNFPINLETDLNNPTWNTDNNSYKILTSPLYLTNIRVFKHMIAQEKQSAILNENIVEDSQLGIIIDNAKPVLKLPKFVDNR